MSFLMNALVFLETVKTVVVFNTDDNRLHTLLRIRFIISCKL